MSPDEQQGVDASLDALRAQQDGLNDALVDDILGVKEQAPATPVEAKWVNLFKSRTGVERVSYMVIPGGRLYRSLLTTPAGLPVATALVFVPDQQPTTEKPE